MAEKIIYESSVAWSEGRKGFLRISDGPEIEISTPPQFGGDKGYWSPEEMFLSAINSCTMTTFLYFVDRFGASFISYESKIEGEVNLVGGRYMFTAISLAPRVVVADESKKEKVQLALDKSEKYCLVSNSTKTEIKVHPEIIVGAG